MQVRHKVNLSLLVHQQKLYKTWLSTRDSKVKRAHSRVVRQKVRVSICFEKEELDYLLCTVLNGKVQQRLTHHLVTVLYLTTSIFLFEHLVHLNELRRLVMLYELDQKQLLVFLVHCR